MVVEEGYTRRIHISLCDRRSIKGLILSKKDDTVVLSGNVTLE